MPPSETELQLQKYKKNKKEKGSLAWTSRGLSSGTGWISVPHSHPWHHSLGLQVRGTVGHTAKRCLSTCPKFSSTFERPHVNLQVELLPQVRAKRALEERRRLVKQAIAKGLVRCRDWAPPAPPAPRSGAHWVSERLHLTSGWL